jgi:hypothetical protein
MTDTVAALNITFVHVAINSLHTNRQDAIISSKTGIM